MGKERRRHSIRERVHTFLNGLKQLLCTVKITPKKRTSEAHSSLPPSVPLSCIGESSGDNRHSRLPIPLCPLYQPDESTPEREKSVEIGLGCGVRIDIGIAFWKHDEHFPGPEQPSCSQHQPPEITPGEDWRIDPWLVFLVLAKLFAAQDNRPIWQ